jgi:hypothetical protein
MTIYKIFFMNNINVSELNNLMSRNLNSEKLYRTIEKKSQHSYSTEKASKLVSNLKYSFDNKCSSTKNSKAKQINFDTEIVHKKSSSRLYKRNIP